MRLLHTSDWHLGHTLRDYERGPEHAAFVSWLLDVIDEERIDVLLVAGDVFETANPSAAAQEAWYAFLAAARRRAPDLDLIVIGGNHDSAARLDAPSPILSSLGVRVVGGLARRADRTIDHDRIILPVRSRSGERAWIAAVPFLRAHDVVETVGDDVLVDGVRAVYDEIFAAVRARRAPREPIVAMGHLFMVDGRISEESERKILGGNQHALPVDIFPEDVAYAALGHLHLAQHVGPSEHVRYSGSPIPLSMAEMNYPHQVSVIELRDGGLAEVRALRVPRSVELRRIPAVGAAGLAEIVTEVRRLPSADSMPRWTWPFLELVIAMDGPEPLLQQQIDDALEGKAARLVKITRALRAGGSAGLPLVLRTLGDLHPEEVFIECYSRAHAAAPTGDYLAAFHELLEAVMLDPT